MFFLLLFFFEYIISFSPSQEVKVKELCLRFHASVENRHTMSSLSRKQIKELMQTLTVVIFAGINLVNIIILNDF